MNAEQINGDGGAPKKNRAAFYLRLGGTFTDPAAVVLAAALAGLG
jgi:hypothetical protein